jgi:hypothetical protein
MCRESPCAPSRCGSLAKMRLIDARGKEKVQCHRLSTTAGCQIRVSSHPNSWRVPHVNRNREVRALFCREVVLPPGGIEDDR